MLLTVFYFSWAFKRGGVAACYIKVSFTNFGGKFENLKFFSFLICVVEKEEISEREEGG